MENHEAQGMQSAQSDIPALSEKDALWKYKTGWRRFFALILDGIFISIIALPFELIYRMLDASAGFGDLEFIVGTIYSVILTAIYGKTPGKHICKLKVVSYPDEGPIGIREAVMREIVPVILVILSLPMAYFWEMTRGPNPIGIAWAAMLILGNSGWVVLEIVTFLLDPKRRAFHDKIAGTAVIKTGTFEFVDSLRKQEDAATGG